MGSSFCESPNTLYSSTPVSSSRADRQCINWLQKCVFSEIMDRYWGTFTLSFGTKMFCKFDFCLCCFNAPIAYVLQDTRTCYKPTQKVLQFLNILKPTGRLMHQQFNLLKPSGFFPYHQGLKFKNSTWFSLCVECFVRISEETATFALYIINWVAFITVVEGVYCAVRTDSLYKVNHVSSLKG